MNVRCRLGDDPDEGLQNTFFKVDQGTVVGGNSFVDMGDEVIARTSFAQNLTDSLWFEVSMLLWKGQGFVCFCQF